MILDVYYQVYCIYRGSPAYIQTTLYTDLGVLKNNPAYDSTHWSMSQIIGISFIFPGFTERLYGSLAPSSVLGLRQNLIFEVFSEDACPKKNCFEKKLFVVAEILSRTFWDGHK